MFNELFVNIIPKITAWAQADENIRCILLVGSRARTDQLADEWADLDIILLAGDVGRLIDGNDWLDQIAPHWLTFVERTGDGSGWERRVMFNGGADVEFVPIPMSVFHDLLRKADPPPGLVDLIRRGYRVIVDKENILTAIQALAIHAHQPQTPTQAEYVNLVHDFWYHTVWTAKHLRRGELWWAKGCCDSYLKERLRQMMEWHTQATRPGTDTWMRGRFLEDWVDLRVLSALPETFAHYDTEEVWKALIASMDLFRWLAMETAEIQEFVYPREGDARASELVQLLYEHSQTHKV
jgi:aminoglycoside 6-adenylyltransferase